MAAEGMDYGVHDMDPQYLYCRVCGKSAAYLVLQAEPSELYKCQGDPSEAKPADGCFVVQLPNSQEFGDPVG